MQNLQPTTIAPPRRWPLYLGGVLLFVLGPVIYAVQLYYWRQLNMPWHVPLLATIGVLLMVISVWQRGGFLRMAGLMLFLFFCGREWYHVLVATRTPEYTGPAQVGKQLPVFATQLADGTSFSNKDLTSGRPTVLLFFRGRW